MIAKICANEDPLEGRTPIIFVLVNSDELTDPVNVYLNSNLGQTPLHLQWSILKTIMEFQEIMFAFIT